MQALESLRGVDTLRGRLVVAGEIADAAGWDWGVLASPSWTVSDARNESGDSYPLPLERDQPPFLQPHCERQCPLPQHGSL